jgi:hypothetical protein
LKFRLSLRPTDQTAQEALILREINVSSVIPFPDAPGAVAAADVERLSGLT